MGYLVTADPAIGPDTVVMIEYRRNPDGRPVPIRYITYAEVRMDKPEVVATQPIQGPIEPPKGLTVGRNCHYVTSSGRHLAAIITDVTDRQAGIVSLIAFDPELGYSPHKYGVRYDPLNPTYDTWHYIEPVID